MNGPNKTVYAYRNRKTAMVREEIRRNESEAHEIATNWREAGDFKIVRVTSFKVGKRPDRSKGERQEYNWAVRAYA